MTLMGINKGRAMRGVAVLIAIALFGVASSAFAISPSEVVIQTPVYRPQFPDFDPPLGKYTYTVSWQGIPAATVTADIEQDGEHYLIEATARTYSGIDLIYRLRYTAQGVLSKSDLMPIRTVIDNRENSRHKRSEIEFKEDGTIHSVFMKKGEEPEIYSFDPENFTLDPFAAAFLARSLDWQPGQVRKFDTFNGKSRYLITLTAEERTTVKVNGEERDVWVVSPYVEKLTDMTSKQKLRKAWIYITADKAREILMIKSEVFIGTVKTKLVEFTPSIRPNAGTQVAQIPQKISVR